MGSIPLEKDLNWWWYKAKNNLLTHILKKFINASNLNVLEIGPGLGNNLQTLSKYGIVDVLETDEDFIDYLKNTNQLKNNFLYHLTTISLSQKYCGLSFKDGEYFIRMK